MGLALRRFKNNLTLFKMAEISLNKITLIILYLYAFMSINIPKNENINVSSARVILNLRFKITTFVYVSFNEPEAFINLYTPG
jgi:hypothetical protein